jgi:hypothetical protein
MNSAPTQRPERFRALPPQALPSLADARRCVSGPTKAALARYCRDAPGLSHASAAARLAQLREHFVPGTALPTAPRRPAVADDDTHDGYFHVQRVAGVAGPVFLHSLLTAARIYHSEMARVVLPPQLPLSGEVVGNAFAGLLDFILGTEIPVSLRGNYQVTEAVPDREPMRRWVQGHQIFAALTQGIVFALQSFEGALQASTTEPCFDESCAHAALRVATALLRASAATFRFTANFSARAYSEIVRPSMMADQLGDGFSGLLSADHRQLVVQLARVRALRPQLACDLQIELVRLAEALSEVYESHKFVCARFDGAQLPSLRCPNANPLPGVDQLERYHRARLDLLGSRDMVPPVERIGAHQAIGPEQSLNSSK